MHFCEQKLSWCCAQPSSNEFDKSVHITKDACKQALHKLLTDNLKIIGFAVWGVIKYLIIVGGIQRKS